MSKHIASLFFSPSELVLLPQVVGVLPTWRSAPLGGASSCLCLRPFFLGVRWRGWRSPSPHFVGPLSQHRRPFTGAACARGPQPRLLSAARTLQSTWGSSIRGPLARRQSRARATVNHRPRAGGTCTSITHQSWGHLPGLPGPRTLCYPFDVLPPTSADLLLDETKPYFLWWQDITVGEFRCRLRTGSEDERAYWLGALLREANSRDVWLFTDPEEVREMWPKVYRHLGKSRGIWCHLLQLEPPGECMP